MRMMVRALHMAGHGQLQGRHVGTLLGSSFATPAAPTTSVGRVIDVPKQGCVAFSTVRAGGGGSNRASWQGGTPT
jgi:hypothetical protein